ncbi:MAG: 50S ribosomal protein L3 [Selenomonadaceae bacterium]|nr:50S ribosomal protein L3 [Selenomonadaceae bacterium]
MSKLILGIKLGMTQLFAEDGKVIPVTVISSGNNVVIRNKNIESDGYYAVQIGFGEIKEKHLTKPMQGHFKKFDVKPVKFIRELRLTGESEYKIGDVIGVDTFAAGEVVDVVGTSKGKGFAGGIKRHNFARGPMGHGSKSHREPGSTGAMLSGPGGRVLKGKKLPGRMGGQRTTIQHLKVVKVDTDRNLILIKGAVPGPKKGLVMIKSTVKPIKEKQHQEPKKGKK